MIDKITYRLKSRTKANIKGVARRILFSLAHFDEIVRQDYSPQAQESSGYNASISSTISGTLAFIKRNPDGSDGKTVFAW